MRNLPFLKRILPALVATAIVMATGANAPAEAAKRSGERRPNFVLILADDLGFGDVGFNGSKEVLTPNLDRLASEGTKLTRMRANCTVCSPTRAAILTGVYADRAGVPGVIRTHADNSWGFLDPDRPTLAHRLGEHGYHTAIVGKWHLGLTAPNLPHQRGFDHFHGFLGDMMDDYVTHLRQGNNYMRLNGETIEPKGHATEIFTDWAIAYLKERSESKDQPFFLYLPYNAPHFPIQPPEEDLRRVQKRLPELSLDRARNVAFVEHLDANIGRVLNAMDQLSLTDSTLLAMTSDNGGSLPHAQNNDPWRGGKQSHYDGGLRVPCVLRCPGVIEAGGVSDEPAMTFDLGATFLDIAGIESPNDQDAVSLRPIIDGRAMPAERPMYFVRREGGGAYGGLAYHALIQGPWKLLRNDPFSPYELYHLESDPQETTNVIGEKPVVVRQMKKLLSEHVQRGGRTAWQSAISGLGSGE